MFAAISLLLTAFLPGGFAFPYPFANSTTPSDGISYNATAINPNDTTVVEYSCEYVYPADVAVVNQRYPDYNSSHLHETASFIMLRREIADNGEIATRVQFRGLPSNTSNITCRLELVLPQPELQRISGFNPSFDVYQVARDVDTIATWNTYAGNNDAELFGRVNGEPDALARTRSVGGVAAINATRCNETLTFQMGMVYNSKDGMPNYWDFSQVSPPAYPVQGFRVVWGC